MGDIDKALYPTIIAYVLAMMLIMFIKPNFLYDEQTNTLKHFGTHKSQTLITLPVVGIFLSVVIYFCIVCYIFMMSKLK